jgi:hypothetical protein
LREIVFIEKSEKNVLKHYFVDFVLLIFFFCRAREHAGGRAHKMSGKIAIVTGATSGVGRLLAFR